MLDLALFAGFVLLCLYIAYERLSNRLLGIAGKGKDVTNNAGCRKTTRFRINGKILHHRFDEIATILLIKNAEIRFIAEIARK